MATDYRKPPITESVVEFRISDQISFETIKKQANKFKRNYTQESQTIEFKGEMSEKGFSGRQEPIGLRFATKDELEILLINKGNIVVSQLAPYPGWEIFSKRILRDFEMFSTVFGRRKLSRIGVRYINRLDIPLETITVEDYLNVTPRIPAFGQKVGRSFALQSTQDLEDGRFGVTIQSATVDSPVPAAMSLLLDVDLFSDSDLPMRTDNIATLLAEMRDIKNRIFETSITDQARKLFS